MIVTTTGFVRRFNFSDMFGNFTPYHHTFGKYVKVYNPDVSLYQDFEIVKLSAKNELGARYEQDISGIHINTMYNVVKWLFDECNGGALTVNEAEVNTLLADTFGSPTVDISVDRMLSDASGNILPNKLTSKFVSGEDTYVYEFWVATGSFEAEHQPSDIVVLDPTGNVDDMLLRKDALFQIIESRGEQALLDELNTASRSHPYTATAAMNLRWVNRDNPSETATLRFNFICYGNVKDNVAALQIAVREHIEENSSAALTVWEKVLPEIFSATTFFMIPNWDLMSVGTEITTAIFNPITNDRRMADFFKNHITGLNGQFVDDNLQSVPTLWQSMTFSTCGSPNNHSGNTAMRHVLKDYILATPSSDNGDFLRMSNATRDFILKIMNYMPVILNYTNGDVLPEGLSEETIDGFRFFTFTSYNIRCKILSREDFETTFG